jgi:outer membrane immunogenic protein
MQESGVPAGFILGVHAMKKILIATVAAVAMASGAASAADMSMPLKAPVMPPPVYSWTGCYLEGGGGGGMWNQSHFNFDTPTGVVNTAEQTTGGRGWYGEVGGGCDYQFSLGNLGNFVVGVLGGYDFMDLKGAYTDTFLGNFSGYEKETSSGFVGGRIGYLVTPNLLTYASGGWTDARFNSVSMALPGAAATVFLPSHTYNGYFLGGGAETSLAGWFNLPKGLFLRTDYRVSTYNKADLVYTTAAGPFGESTQMNKYVQQIGTELIYRFNYH